MMTLASWCTVTMGCNGGTKSAIVSVDLFKSVEAVPASELSLAMRGVSREVSLAMRGVSFRLLLVACLTILGPLGDMLGWCFGGS